MSKRARCVYIIGPISGKPVKVGYATDARKRLAALQVGNPSELHILHLVELLNDSEAEQLESILHHALSDHHIRGEWFDVSIDDATEAINELLNGQILAARTLMRFDTSGHVAEATRERIGRVALKTMINNAVC